MRWLLLVSASAWMGSPLRWSWRQRARGCSRSSSWQNGCNTMPPSWLAPGAPVYPSTAPSAPQSTGVTNCSASKSRPGCGADGAVQTHDAVARYRLLQPIRQYAEERLEASDDATTHRARHSSAMLQFILSNQAGGPGPDEVASLDRLEAEHDNIRVALRWALSHGNAQAVLRCSAALFRFWERRGHFQEGCAW